MMVGAAAEPWNVIGQGLLEALRMLWATLWALILGFTLSGAIQAFVPRSALRRRLGDHAPMAVVRAAAYGMVSSSCSYAASAMTRSLIAKGADAVASLVFMVASTNLVIELGIVLLVLIGWQFLVAEFVGGIVMIVLLAALGGMWLRGRAVAAAVDRVRAAAPVSADLPQRGTVAQRLRSRAGWSDAAGYALGDLQMLRREMVIGFLVAGFLTVLVPAWLWGAVFVRGHGLATSVENAVVGPAVAIVSFVCSVGNVPLAAALWAGGVSFGGTVAFIFADLITLPLLLIYRRQYGTAMALRMLALLWTVMSVAGLVTEGLFSLVGWLPSHQRVAVAIGDGFGLNATTVLDVIALAVFGGLVWLYRSRAAAGGGEGYARDPVCGMQVELATAPATLETPGGVIAFCSEHCRERYQAGVAAPQAVLREALDPVCGMTVDPATAPHVSHAGQQVFFCCEHCAETFAADPDRFSAPVTDPVCGMQVSPLEAADHRRTGAGHVWFCSPGCAATFDTRERPGASPDGHGGQVLDPVCGMWVTPTANGPAVEYRGHRVSFCCEHCAETFGSDPERVSAPVTDPVCGMQVSPLEAADHRRTGAGHVWFCSPGCATAFDVAAPKVAPQ